MTTVRQRMAALFAAFSMIAACGPTPVVETPVIETTAMRVSETPASTDVNRAVQTVEQIPHGTTSKGPFIPEGMPLAYAPTYGIGDTWVWRMRDGSQATESITAVDGTLLRFEAEGTACTYSVRNGPMGPLSEWSNCDETFGTQDTVETASLFPLQIGRTGSWDITQFNNKGVMLYTQTCTTAGTKRVRVPAGTFETFLVRCETDEQLREWYYAPAISSPVVYRRTMKQTKNLKVRKLVSFTRG